MARGKKERVGAVIVAAGKSQRMGDVDKMFTPLGGQPVLLRTIRPFQQCSRIDRIVVVVSREKEALSRHLLAGPDWSKVSHVCLGGRRRQDSVAEGLKHLVGCDWVVIHDGARPLVTVELIERGLEAARETGAAVAAVPVTDTIKVSDEDGTVHETPPRQNLWAVQTPQVFQVKIVTEAYKNANEDVTDSSALVERLGYKVKLYMGDYENIKITTPADLVLAEILWQKREK